MSSRALILTYHAIDHGPSPLCCESRLFRDHLELIAAAGVPVVTISQLAGRVRAGDLGEPCVAITFDDGFASVASNAAPLLAERGMPATMFCVAGHLGGSNNWPSQPAGSPRRALASADQLAELALSGFEIGAHGNVHAPLGTAGPKLAREEVVDAKLALENAIGSPVASFAYPYGAHPSMVARRLVASAYRAACGTRLDRVDAGTDLFELPRIDAHYLRQPRLLSRVLSGRLDSYLWLRRSGAGIRRVVHNDYK